MSSGDSGRSADARSAARERARELREQRRKQDRRTRTIVAGSVAGGIVVAVAIVALVLVNIGPGGRGPLNMASDGIRIGEGLVAQSTIGLPDGASPRPGATNPPEVVDIRIYFDYLCQNCGTFVERNGDLIRSLVDEGAATVEFHPLAVLTTQSAGTQYSLRAANASACVAEYSPDHFFDFTLAMLSDQPAEGSPGLADDEILDRAQQAGVANITRIKACVEQRAFVDWVRAATDRALAGPIPGSNVVAISATPTIIVDGQQFHTASFDPGEFGQFLQQAAGETFVQNSTPTPTPTPTDGP